MAKAKAKANDGSPTRKLLTDDEAAEAVAEQGKKALIDRSDSTARSVKRRGHQRRITKAANRMRDVTKECLKELDRFMYQDDETGNRVADWPAIKEMEQISLDFHNAVNRVLYPPAPPAPVKQQN